MKGGINMNKYIKISICLGILIAIGISIAILGRQLYIYLYEPPKVKVYTRGETLYVVSLTVITVVAILAHRNNRKK